MPKLREYLMQTKAPSYVDDPSFVALRRNELRAWRAVHFQALIVPGELQTPAYAHAVVAAFVSSPEEIEEMVAVRLARQRRLFHPDPIELVAILGEGALRTVVGGAEVQQEQLAHLLDMAEQPHITLRVVPFGAGPSKAMTAASCVMLEFRDRGPAVYLERFPDQQFYHPREAAVAVYQAMLSELMDLALTPEESADLVPQVMLEL
jgi:hypothetical protein